MATLDFGDVSTTSGMLRMQGTEVSANGGFAGRGPYDVGFSSIDDAVTGTPTTATPEPATLVLVGAGVLALGLRRWRGARVAV